MELNPGKEKRKEEETYRGTRKQQTYFRSYSTRLSSLRTHNDREKKSQYIMHIPTCITCMHAYIHTYIHTYIYTDRKADRSTGAVLWRVAISN